MGDPLHVLICDDHPLMAQALAAAVTARLPESQLVLVGNFPDAIAAAPSAQLILADLAMPGATPRAGIDAIVAAAPAARIIVVSGLADEALLRGLVASGIAGFLPKSTSVAVIGAAIDLVLAGGRYLPPLLADPVRSKPPPTRDRLSPRQLEVAALLVRGLSNKEMARQLNIAPATIKVHVAQVMAALDAENRTSAAIKAREMGIA